MYHPGMKRRFWVFLAALSVVAAGALAAEACAAEARAQAPAADSKPAQAAPASPAAPAMKTWFLRLIPPWPTFDKDITDAEGALMEQHFVYWKAQFDKGVCLFGGPVLDPRGVYGVLAIRAATQEEAQAIANGDPSVKAGLNKMEVAEMKIAFLPQGH
jgi:uncharacterized protein